MTRHFSILAVVAILVLCTSCATTKLKSDRTLEASARTFMAGYGDDVVAQNREAIIARYHPQGVLMIGEGEDCFKSAQQIADYYRREWKGPRAFFWESLHYRAVSQDVVLIDGRFTWQDTSTAKTRYSYSAVLVSVSGAFKIRSEVEFPEN